MDRSLTMGRWQVRWFNAAIAAYVVLAWVIVLAAPGLSSAAAALPYVDWPLELAVVLAGAAVAASPRHHRHLRQAWTLLCGAYLCLFLAEFLPALMPLPQAALAVIWFCVHPLLLLAWLRLQSLLSSRGEATGLLLDALIVVLGTSVALWALFLEAAFEIGLWRQPARIVVALGFPIGDLILLFGLATIVLFRPTGRSRLVYLWLIAALLLALFGDLLWTRELARAEEVVVPLLSQLVWLASPACVVIAADLQQRAGRLRTAEQPETRSANLAGVPFAAAAIGIGVLVIQELGRPEGASRVVVIATALLFGAVLLRLVLAQRQAITVARLRAERESEQKRDAMVEHSADAIVVIDADRRLQFFNPGFQRMVGRTCRVGDAFPDLVLEQDRGRLERVLCRSTGGGPHRARLRLDRDGETVLAEVAISDFEDDDGDALVVNLRDVTKQVALEEQLTARSLRDGLTGLPNRALFADRVGQALARSTGSDRNVAILMADLDRFKAVNDTLGHGIGDRVLIEGGRRLTALPELADATIARTADDEFAVLLEGRRNHAATVAVAEAARAALGAPFVFPEGSVVLTASIGVAGPTRGLAPKELLRQADVAMNQAKVNGRNRVESFDPDVDQTLGSEAMLLSALRSAIYEERIDVVFQPIFDADRRLFGYEALARWLGEDGLAVSPERFIALAEGAGLMPVLGARILNLALDRAAGAGIDSVLSVNISGLQLADAGFSREALALLATFRWPPTRLILEITETVITENRPAVRANLDELRDAGVRIAIDDFGTGYSSLSQLHQFPVDVLKIDRGFINMIESPSGAETTRAVIAIGRALDLQIIAEGIETEQQLSVLLTLGCDYLQGYLLGRPVPADAMPTIPA